MKELTKFFMELPQIEHRLLNTHNTSAFPPFNMAKLKNGNTRLEFALCGYTKEDVKVTVLDGYLEVEGRSLERDDIAEYMTKGLSTKAFKKTFRLSEYVYVKSAKFENGILQVELEEKVPEEKQPLLIKIEE